MESRRAIVDQRNEIANRAMRLDRMPQVPFRQNAVMILAADLFALNEAARLQVGKKSLHGSFGNPNLPGHFSQHQRRVAGQQQQHMRVVRQERPATQVLIALCDRRRDSGGAGDSPTGNRAWARFR